jgi:murein L,D-transpeptidase YafK
MRRAVVLLALLLPLAGAVGLWWKPELGVSARDRLVRTVGRFAPETAIRWRLGNDLPLKKRLADRGFTLGNEAFIRIFKEEHELEVWLKQDDGFERFQAYRICNWSGELGPKLKEGDGQSPEGFYAVGLRQLNEKSAYFRAFNLGFPNAYDQAHGRTGSFLMVHGDCVSVGCYAMTDKGIDDIYRIVEGALRNGQRAVPVHVFPFRLTDEKLTSRAGHQWASFWMNLKEGHDLFERTKVPPTAHVCGTRYTFNGATGACAPIKAW